MLTQSTFIERLGICQKTLKEVQKKGLFLPVAKNQTGKRFYYSEEQVSEYKRYVGLSVIEFSKAIGVSIATLYAWNSNGRLVADHTTDSGHIRYSYDQIDKYFAGEYDGIHEDGFLDRKSFAQRVGVSESLVILWNKKGLLHPDHKSITRIWQYREEQIEEARKLRKFKRTS